MISSNKYSLIDLFKSIPNEEGNTNLPLKIIEIPIIQRDYAQGRNLPEVNRIRSRFLSSLYDALTKAEAITLDFVYGKIENGKLIPLDGQQRLTTLYLLHWYIARHESIELDKLDFLSNFSYATRYSARDFCQRLVEPTYSPNFEKEKLSDDITDQSWMPRDWQHDPTISAMLNMLDDIHCKFKETSGLWEQLENGCITFYFLSLEDLGATDELYIKMNSRGKPLTEFEHFKAEWESSIKSVEPKLSEDEILLGKKTISQKIGNKIDLNWTDMLWPYRNSEVGNSDDDVIDDEFVRYFRFLTDIIYIMNDEVVKKSEDIFQITKELFSQANSNAIENTKFIEKGFDCWTGIDIESLFAKYLSTVPVENSNKCIVTEPINIFSEACKYYGEQQKGQRRKFPIGRMVLLYAFVYYLLHKDSISEDQFARRIRIITNLIKGSEFELREDNLCNLFHQTEYVLQNGDIEEGYTSFGANQLIEEHEKVEWLKSNEDKMKKLFKLEDHPLLNGAVRAVGLNNVDFVDRFYSLFECDWSLVNRALLTIGDYSLSVNGRYQIGTKTNETTWRSIFRTKKEELVETNRVLLQLLSKYETFTNEKLQQIIDDYLIDRKDYDWRHYIVKYSSMRLERWGMYYWHDNKTRGKESYKILMMWTEKSITGKNYNIFLKALYDHIKELNPELTIYLGEYAYSNDGDVLKLIFADKYLYFTDTEICICHNEKDEEENKIEFIDSTTPIPQINGVDCEDRVELAYSVIESLMMD